ncbi:ComGF family competence protein [Liquorilactobacillus capillatus]|uniref:ComGF family competence protein n=1 Tax=Liquorilactobacillus capillatus TaxID=480931 RepID=UPI00138F5889|nr:ComGF family competence protein [Liquorilactobacillus capillatus]
MKLKLKKTDKLASFTLVETISALIVTVIAFSILGVAIKSSNIAIRQSQRSDEFEWTQFVDLVSSDDLGLEYVAGKNLVRFYSPTKEKTYRLYYKNDVIRMTGVEAGYVPLLYDVSFFTTEYKDATLTMKVRMRERDYVCHVVMPKRKMEE